jgi:hypothetical protein
MHRRRHLANAQRITLKLLCEGLFGIFQLAQNVLSPHLYTLLLSSNVLLFLLHLGGSDVHGFDLVRL